MWTLVAALFALLALGLLLVWPLAMATPGTRFQVLQSPAGRMVIGTAATAAFSALITPLLVAALISGADTVQFAAYEFGNLSFGM